MAKSVAALQQGADKDPDRPRAHELAGPHHRRVLRQPDVPLNQVSNVGVEDSTDTGRDAVGKGHGASAIEKAIMTSDLGLNPATAGTVIRVCRYRH